jgi:rhodanese-related sulfurtransferase
MHVSQDELAAEIAAGSPPAILDVRSRAEFVRGHVPGAIHIPFWRLLRRMASIPASRDDRLVLYCGHGPRAWMAGAVLRTTGFRHVSYLEGHMSAWSRAGLPQERQGS